MFPEAMLSICAALNCDGQCFGRRSTIFEGSVVVRGCFIISGQRLIIMGQTEQRLFRQDDALLAPELFLFASASFLQPADTVDGKCHTTADARLPL